MFKLNRKMVKTHSVGPICMEEEYHRIIKDLAKRTGLSVGETCRQMIVYAIDNMK